MKKAPLHLKRIPKSVRNAGIAQKKESNNKNLCPLAGIGASAGGLEALEQFFSNMSDNSGIAFVIVQHLDPDYKGMMPELIQRYTSMKVIQASDGMRTKPNCVYVIPPNKSMSVLKGRLHLFAPIEPRGMRLPIDFFFRSLAEDCQEKSIAIILSGMGSDGSSGARSIKEKGGIVLVQDPESAKFSSMPRSVIEAALVDVSAPADELPEKLITLLKNTRILKYPTQKEVKEKSSLEKIIILLRAKTSHDFVLYKKNTMYRRVERRMLVNKIDNIAAYIRLLQENPKETEILFKELLIGVTNFFRDPAVWEYLKEKLFPAIFDSLPDRYAFRAWVAACATGEEAYSLAIVFREALDLYKQQKNKNFTLQIFATDLDGDSINKARKAFYSSNIAADVSAERLDRFFIPFEDGFCVKSEIREMIVFAQQNLTKDPPFTRLDILSCRNLLIYLEQELQKKLISLFYYSLNPNGTLVIGTSESIGDNRMLFHTQESKLRIYKREASVLPTETPGFVTSFTKFKTEPDTHHSHIKPSDNIQSLSDQLLLQQFTPSSVLFNTEGDIIYIHGRTGNYLEPASGKANMNIFAMARPGLRNDLTLAFHKALKSYQKHIYRNIKVKDGELTCVIDLTVQKIEKPEPLKDLIIAVFSEVPDNVESKSQKSKKISSTDNSREKELKNELERVKEEMQKSIEDMQTTQEEFRSANEELQSTNEELQSTNEELTTSKEEMQSLNEELQTVNLELQSKVDEFTQVNNDMINLLNSTDIATLFIDRNLHIRRFTKQTTKIIKLIQSDIGRSFTDLVSDLVYPDILNDVQEVLRTLIFVEKDISTNDGRWFKTRIMPYRTSDDRIEGLVITFTDVTKAKNLEAELNKTIALLRSHNINKPDNNEKA